MTRSLRLNETVVTVRSTRSKRNKNRVRTNPSIPSKFQTNIKFNYSENDAFGSTSHRFSSGSSSSVPGPGSYTKQVSMLRGEAEVCGSVSKKGYGGGFVSKTKRFATNKDMDDASMPGPGQYCGVQNVIHDKKDFNKAKTSRAFAKTRPSAHKVNPVGPGQYDHHTTFKVRRKEPSSSFSSTSKRGLQFYDDMPPPGAYNTPDEFNVAKKAASISVFKSQSSRTDFTKGGNAKNPGPGAYKVAKKSIIDNELNRVSCNNPSSFFAKNDLDRFGNPIEKKTKVTDYPGPGAYDVNSNIRYTNMPGCVGSFVSGTKRNESRKDAPPGPAYYKEVKVPEARRSYLLNPKKNWV